jgi:transposase
MFYMEVKTPFELSQQRLGPLPIINRFIDRLGLDEAFAEFIPSQDRSTDLPYAKALGVLLRSIIVERDPIYRQQETVQTFAPGAFGVEAEDVAGLSDDRIGRALDRLFDADRAEMMTKVVVRMAKRFDVRFDELHNDSTSISFTGQYRDADGRSLRGKRAPWITYGYSKDHRPDLKQLLFILTTSADGGVPVQFRCEDGNRSDVDTHIDTWEALRKIAGKPDFLYVADSKLCVTETMDYIDQREGRFVTVLPRTRQEDGQFRKWLQTNTPAWEPVWDRPNPRRKHGPRDRWRVVQDQGLSQESWRIVWVHSSLLALKHDRHRRESLAAAKEAFADLKTRLASPKTRLRKPAVIQEYVDRLLRRHGVKRYLKVRIFVHEDHEYTQSQRGRPGKQTTYRRLTRRRWDVEWEEDSAAVEYDRKSDGMYPLMTNDKSLTLAQVLEAHKGQPEIEKRFHQCKTVHELAPVLLHNEGRVEAFFFLYFLALLVQGLIERELRRAMAREGVVQLPIYAEARQCRHPTTEQVLRLFALTQRGVLTRGGDIYQVFEPKFSNLQRQVLNLLGIPLRAYERLR